jgi:TRAP-type C4-dicarboxylate transport system permease small subunit
MARLFNFSPKWGDELQRYLMIGMVFSAIPYMANAKTFLVVDLTAIFFGKKKEFNRSMILIGEVIFLVFVIYLIFPCMELTLKNVQLLTPALRWRKAAVYSFMPISFVFAAIAEIKNLLKFFLVDKVVKKAGEAH